MRSVSKILHLSIFFLIVCNDSISQKTPNKKSSLQKDTINPPRVPVPPVTDLTESRNIDLSGAIMINPNRPENVVNNFINERKYPEFYTLSSGNISLKKAPIDSLFPYFEAEVKAFLKTYKETEYDSKKYLKTRIGFIISKELDDLSNNDGSKKNPNRTLAIKSQINSLTISLEKISLLVQYEYLNIRVVNYNDEIISFFRQINFELNQKEFNKLAPYEKGQITKLIGDFGVHFHEFDIAIQFYFYARVILDQSNLKDSIKNNEQGLLCEKIAGIFFYYTRRESGIKQQEYYEKAANYFYNARNFKKGNQCYLYAIAARTRLDRTDTTYLIQSPEESFHSSLIENNLFDLWDWYIKYKQKSRDYTTDYLGLVSIANILSKNAEYEVALKYSVSAFFKANASKNIDIISNCVSTMAYIYSFKGNTELAIKYCDLNILLNTYDPPDMYYYNALLNKIDIYNNLQKYDSASLYINRIINDTSLEKTFYPIFYQQLMKEVYSDKYNLEEDLESDSILYYKDFYTYYSSLEDNSFLDVIKSENEIVNLWLELSKNKDLDNKDELITIKERDIKSLKRERLLLDSISILKLHNAYDSTTQALEGKRLSDSLRLRNDSLSKTIIATTINLSNDRIKANNENTRNWVIIASLIILILVGTYFYYNASKNASRVSELNRVNDLAKNKIHNIENDYSVIGDLLSKKEYDKLDDYNTKYESFLAVFLDNWKNSKVSLQNELDALERYYSTQKVLKPNLYIKIKNELPESSRIWFVQSVFDTLLHNAVKYAFDYKLSECRFSVFIRREGNFLYCTITDNGKPSEEFEYLAKKDSGLNILKKRVENFYRETRRKQSLDYFRIDRLAGNSGTIIYIKLPYEEI